MGFLLSWIFTPNTDHTPLKLTYTQKNIDNAQVTPSPSTEESMEHIDPSQIEIIEEPTHTKKSPIQEKLLDKTQNKDLIKSSYSHSAPQQTPIKSDVPTQNKQLYSIKISSKPWGAKVYVDGNFIGQTLTKQIQLSSGEHQIRMKLHNKEIKKKVTINKNYTFMWNVEKNSWDSISQ